MRSPARKRRLNANPNDQDALFAMCITSGVLTDYTALVEKKQISSLSLVKKGAAYAQRLLKLNPELLRRLPHHGHDRIRDREPAVFRALVHQGGEHQRQQGAGHQDG